MVLVSELGETLALTLEKGLFFTIGVPGSFQQGPRCMHPQPTLPSLTPASWHLRK